MAKDIRQQLFHQSYGFPVDKDVAAQLDADWARETAQAKRLRELARYLANGDEVYTFQANHYRVLSIVREGVDPDVAIEASNLDTGDVEFFGYDQIDYIVGHKLPGQTPSRTPILDAAEPLRLP